MTIYVNKFFRAFMKVVFEHQSHPSGSAVLVKEYVQNHFTSPFHFHDLYELIWIKKSFGKLYAGKNIINFQEDDMYLFGPGFGHCFYNEKSFIELGEKAEAIAVFFKEDFFSEGFLKNTAYAKLKEVLERSAFGLHITNPSKPLRDLFGNITRQKGLEELISFLGMLNQVSLLPQADIRVLNETQSIMKLTNKDSARLEVVIKYLMDNFREEVDSKIAAQHIHLNEAAFCRYFKKRMEQTFSQFVNHVRIAHASSLLITEEWDVLRICFESGYKNLSYFNRQFRDIMKQSPKEYRAAFRDKNQNLVMDHQED